MNTLLLTIFAVVALLAAALAGLNGLLQRRRPVFSNAAPPNTEPQGKTTLVAEETDGIPRYRLVTQGTADEEAELADEDDKPVGASMDKGADGEHFSVALLGIYPESLRFVADGGIAAGADVYGADDGLVQAQPATAGIYWLIGSARNTVTDGQEVIVRHHAPVRVAVLANAADLTAIKAAATAGSRIMFLPA